MKRNEDLFSSPQKQSSTVIIVAVFKYFSSIIRQAIWPLIILFFFGSGTDFFTRIIIVTSIFAGVFSIFSAVIKYYYFFFWCEDGEMRVRSGLFQKRDLSIPFNKIQRVEIEQNVVHRILNVVTLKIETAGGKGEELSIGSLKRPMAEALRARLMGEEGLQKSVEEKESEDHPIFRLSFIQLVKAGLIQNHFRTAGVIMGFLAGIYFQFEEVINLDEWLSKWLPAWYYSSDGVWSLLGLIPLALILVIGLTLIITVAQYFNFTIWKKKDGYRFEYGLFNRRTYSALVRKIQYIKWQNNPFLRLLGMYRMAIFQAGSVAQRRSQALLAPACFDNQIDMITHDAFAQWSAEQYRSLRANQSYVYYLFTRLGLIPMIILIGNGFLRDSWAWWLTMACIWGVVAFLWSWFYAKTLRLYLSANHILMVKGLYDRKRFLFDISKLQGASLGQNPIESRRNLSTLHIYTAAGSLSFPYLPNDQAYGLLNYILFVVETSKKPWM